MAKQGRVLPARKSDLQTGDEESLLIRSAESLGRVIGSLQRELEKTARHVTGTKRTTKKRASGNGAVARKAARKK